MAQAPKVLHSDAILFDMDGTLVDSNSVVEAMWADFAATWDLDVAQVLAFSHGTPSIDTLRRFLPSDQDLHTWLERIGAWEIDHFDDVHPVPGAVELVGALPSHLWAVVTSAIADAARRRLHVTGFPAPSVLVGADDVSRGKPDAEGFVSAAKALGVDPRHCVVFEDSPAGIAAGLAAGCTVVRVGGSTHDEDFDSRVIATVENLEAVTVEVSESGLALTIA